MWICLKSDTKPTLMLEWVIFHVIDGSLNKSTSPYLLIYFKKFNTFGPTVTFLFSKMLSGCIHQKKLRNKPNALEF